MVKRNAGRDHVFVTAAPCLRHISRRWVYCTSSNDLRRKRVCEKTNKFVFKRISTLISAFSSRNSHIRPSFQSFFAFPRTKRCAFPRSISQAALDFGFSRHRNIDVFCALFVDCSTILSYNASAEPLKYRSSIHQERSCVRGYQSI